MTTSSRSGRRVRLDDVAADVGVSPATVSLVLRGIAGPSAATRERVLAAATRLGYRPDRLASALASRRSRMVGVLMDVSNPYQSRLVLDLYEAAERSDYSLVLSTVNRSHDENRSIETLLDSRCEALVLFGPGISNQLLNRLGASVPLVVVGRAVPEERLTWFVPPMTTGSRVRCVVWSSSVTGESPTSAVRAVRSPPCGASATRTPCRTRVWPSMSM